MDKQNLLEFHKVNKIFKFFLDSTASGYDNPIVIDDEIKEIITTPRYFFEAILSTLTHHVAYGQEEKLFDDFNPKIVQFYLKAFKNIKILGNDRADTNTERLRQIRNCILHHNIEYDDEHKVVRLKNKYIETEIDYEDFTPSIFELFSSKSHYKFGSDESFSLLSPDHGAIKNKEELDRRLKRLKLFTYKMPANLDETATDGTNLLLKAVYDYTMSHFIDEEISDLPINIEGKIKILGSQYKKKLPQAINQVPMSKEARKKTLDRNTRLINTYLSSIKVKGINDLLPEIYDRIEYIGYDKFFELDVLSQEPVVISTVIEKLFSKERNDNDYYNLLFMTTLQDYLKRNPNVREITLPELNESTKEYQIKKFEVFNSNEDKTMRVEKPIMYKYFLLGQMNYMVTKFKSIIDKTDNDIDIDLYKIDIPDDIKYKCIIPISEAQEDIDKISGIEQDLQGRKQKMLKLFRKQIGLTKAVNPKNPKADEAKNTMLENRQDAVGLFLQYRELHGKKGTLLKKKEEIDKQRAIKSSVKEIVITDDKKEFFRRFRNALAHSYIDINMTPGLKAKDLSQTKIKIYDYETKINNKTGEHIVNKNKKIFEAEMTAKDFLKLTECIMKTMDDYYNKDKISLSDIVRDSLFSDLGISESDLHEELIPDQPIR